MAGGNILLVMDMQKGVFAEPLFDPVGRITSVNQLIDAACQVVFIQHVDARMTEGSAAWQLLDELHQPENACCLVKTACDAFYHSALESLLRERSAAEIIVCGCTTDFCVDATVKNGVSKGFSLVVAGDAHTTADSPYASAQQLIAHHNYVWSNLTVPEAKVEVKTTSEILQSWSCAAA